MSYFVNKKDVEGVQMGGHVSYPMLNESNGCVAGFCYEDACPFGWKGADV